MKTPTIEQRLENIEHKLDRLVQQMEITRRRQRELEELKDDLGRIASDVFSTATVELEEVAPYFESDDLMHLVKKLLRNTRNLELMLEQMESAIDFFRDAAHLRKEIFQKVLANLDELDRQGYFEFLAEARRLLDHIVTSFSPEDVRLLGENIVTILLTVKNFTQPEILQALNNALSVYQHLPAAVEEEVSYLSLIRQARSPEVKRGLAMGVQFLKNVSSLEATPAAETTAVGDAATLD